MIRAIYFLLFLPFPKNSRISHHFAYPTLQDGSIEIATEFCLVGEITQVWSTTHEWEEHVTTILRRALAFLQLNS